MTARFAKSGGSGNSDVSIDWEVENNGDIEVESGTIRFFGDVAHHGTVDLTGGNVEFRGNVMGEGNFTGTGLATFRRDYRPGASPAAISFGGDLRFDSSAANLFVEIGGTDTGQFDQLLVAGTAELAGSLRVQWIDLGSGLFAPSAGDAFEIVSAEGGITGALTPILPALADGLAWKVMKSSTSLSLLVESTGSDTLLGDYNLNGIVDAADYTVWRNSFGQAGAGLAADGNDDRDDRRPGLRCLEVTFWRIHANWRWRRNGKCSCRAGAQRDLSGCDWSAAAFLAITFCAEPQVI